MIKNGFIAALFGLMLIVHPGMLPAQAQPYSVAILVVDDFSGTDLSDLSSGQYQSGDNCAVNLEGQAFAVRGSSAAPLDQPHGDIVAGQIQDMLDQAGLTDTIPVVQVDIHGMKTQDAAAQIQDAINANPADFYVINMSFAIIPCEFLQSFTDFGSQLQDAHNNGNRGQYRSLFQRAVIFYGDQVFPAMSKHAQDLQNLDPLQDLFTNLGSQAISVASAGNFGLGYPFWPGAWSQVISVSGSTGQGYYPSASWDKKKDTPLLMGDSDQSNKKQRVSNYGEVMMPGEYTSGSSTYVGTSFAAPRLSVVMALYLQQVGSANCRNNNGGPALAYGDWKNLTLREAAQQYCPDLTSYLPAS